MDGKRDVARLPYLWEVFSIYSKENFRRNEGIYNSFTDVQLEVIQDYFRWFTRSIVEKRLKNTSLQAKPKKAGVFSEIMGCVDDWVYDGCVDTGYFGGGQCDLGHKLRYEHYAKSPSTGLCLAFGVTCASDFFGIDSKVLSGISKVQEEILEEIKFIAFIKNTGRHAEYFKDMYGDLMDVINVLRGEMNEAFGEDWNRHMANFLKHKIPWTPTMVRVYTGVYGGIYKQRVKENKAKNVIASILDGKEELNKKLQGGGLKRGIHYTNIIMELLEGKYGDVMEVKEEMAKFLSTAERLSGAYKALVEIKITDLRRMAVLSTRDVCYTDGALGRRLATIKEKNVMPPETRWVTERVVSKDASRAFSILDWAINGSVDSFRDAGLGSYYPAYTVRELGRADDILNKAIDLVMDRESLTDVIKKIHEGKMRVDAYPETADDEIEYFDQKDLIMYFLKYNGKLKGANGLVDTALSIAGGSLNYSMTVTRAQERVLRNALELIKKVESGGLHITDACRRRDIEPDLFEKMKKLEQEKNHPSLKNSEFAFKVMGTVLRYGRATDKQKKVIEEAYNKLIAGINEEKARGSVGVGTETAPEKREVTEMGEESVFIKSKDRDDNKLGGIQNGGADESVFIESRDYGGDNDWEPGMAVEDTGFEMPAITKISEALGGGEFDVEYDTWEDSDAGQGQEE